MKHIFLGESYTMVYRADDRYTNGIAWDKKEILEKIICELEELHIIAYAGETIILNGERVKILNIEKDLSRDAYIYTTDKIINKIIDYKSLEDAYNKALQSEREQYKALEGSYYDILNENKKLKERNLWERLLNKI